MSKGYVSYRVNGTELYFGKCKDQITDGILTVSVIEAVENNFCLQTLMKERENQSLVFEYEVLSEQFIETYPPFGLIAN